MAGFRIESTCFPATNTAIKSLNLFEPLEDLDCLRVDCGRQRNAFEEVVSSFRCMIYRNRETEFERDSVDITRFLRSRYGTNLYAFVQSEPKICAKTWVRISSSSFPFSISLSLSHFHSQSSSSLIWWHLVSFRLVESRISVNINSRKHFFTFTFAGTHDNTRTICLTVTKTRY